MLSTSSRDHSDSRLVRPDSLSAEAMSDIDLEEISIVSFETAERKPEEAEVEMVEVRAVRAAERENVRGGECEGEYACEVQAPAIGRCAGRAFCPVTWCMRGRAAGSRGGGAHRGPR